MTTIDYLWPQIATQPLLTLLVALGCFAVGSAPVGLMLVRAAGLGDIRRVGSGNIGATNVLRTGKRWVALATLILDMAKGAAAGLIALRAFYSLPDHFGPDLTRGPFVTVALAGGALAVLGHCFSPMLGFKGGKGVATTLGTLLLAAWPVGLGALGVWLLVAVLSRYSSLAALVSLGLSVAAVGVFWGGWLPGLVALGMVAVVVWRHRGNIQRLRAGTESRISLGGGRSAASGASPASQQPGPDDVTG